MANAGGKVKTYALSTSSILLVLCQCEYIEAIFQFVTAYSMRGVYHIKKENKSQTFREEATTALAHFQTGRLSRLNMGSKTEEHRQTITAPGLNRTHATLVGDYNSLGKWWETSSLVNTGAGRKALSVLCHHPCSPQLNLVLAAISLP